MLATGTNGDNAFGRIHNDWYCGYRLGSCEHGPGALGSR